MQKLFVKRQMSQTFTHTRFNGHMREIYLFDMCLSFWVETVREHKIDVKRAQINLKQVSQR